MAMITITTINNAKKYLNAKGIENNNNFKSDLQLFEFAKIIRNKEKIEYMKKEKVTTDSEEKIFINSLLKTEDWGESFFFSEGIQEVDYSKHNDLFLHFICAEELYNHNKLKGPNYFEFFSSFIDVFENYCRVRTNTGTKTLKKNDIIDIFGDIKLYIVDDRKHLLEKLMIKEFLKECLYRKQFYQIREEIQNNDTEEITIYTFLNDLKNRNYICNNETYNNEKGISGYFLFFDYQHFCKLHKTKPEQKKIFIQECKKNFKWITKSKRILKQVIKDTCFFVF